MHACRTLIVILITLWTPLLARTQDPVVPEDLWTLPQASAPHYHPDGGSALYQLRQADRERNRVQSVLMWVDLERLERSPLTFNATDVQWSPDGEQISFRGQYGPNYGLYRAALVDEASEDRVRLDPPLLLAEFPERQHEGIINHAWNPDGQTMAFTAADPGDCSTEGAATEPRIIEKGSLLTEPCPTRIFLLSARGGEAARAISPEDRSSHALAWSPDGSRLAFLAHDPADPTAGHQLWMMEAASEQARAIASGLRGEQLPRWAPDGSQLMVAVDDPSTGGSHLRLLSPEGQVQTDLEHSPPYRPGSGRWGPEGDWVYWQALDAGRHCIFRQRPGGETESVICREGMTGGYDLSAEKLIYAYETPEQPANLVQADPDGMFNEPVTFHARAWLRGKQLAETETFPFVGPEGEEQTGFLVHPPGMEGDREVPVVHLLPDPEGDLYGYDFSFLLHLLASQGYAVVYTVPESGFPLELNDLAGRLQTQYQTQAAALRAALEAFEALDGDQVAVVGQSYGTLPAHQLLYGDQPYRAGVLWSGPSNLLVYFGSGEPSLLRGDGQADMETLWALSPLQRAHTIDIPILLLHGSDDKLVPARQARALLAALGGEGSSSRLVLYPGEGHRLTKPASVVHAYEQLMGWLDQHLRVAR